MSFDPLKAVLGILAKASTDAWRDERGTESGRINLTGMVCAVVVCILFGAVGLVEHLFAGVRAVLYNVDLPSLDSPLPYLIGFAIWTAACMSIGLIDRRSREREEQQ